MARFSTFKKATPWAAPKLAQATAFQGELDAQAAARDNEIRAQNQGGLAKGYQHFTKDMETDPIADALRSGYGKMMGHGEGVDIGTGLDNSGLFGEQASTTTAQNVAELDAVTSGGGELAALAEGGESAAALADAASAFEASALGAEAVGAGSTAGTAAGLNAANTVGAQAAAQAAAAQAAAAGGTTAATTAGTAAGPPGWLLMAGATIASLLANKNR